MTQNTRESSILNTRQVHQGGLVMPEVIPQARYHYRAGAWDSQVTEVVSEEPLRVHVNGRELATLIATPSHVEELVCGFLGMEKIIRSRQDITIFQYHPEDQAVWVRIPGVDATRLDNFSRPTLSGCCGRGRPTLYFANDDDLAAVTSTATIAPEDIFKVFSQLSHQSRQQHSGGLHAAAWSVTPGQLDVVRMDVGRHNALDKVFGWSLIQNQNTANGIVVFSGRLSSEVIIKVAHMGVGLIISNAAPTSLGLELADSLNITAVGFARDEEFSVYTHPERIESAISLEI